jgi:hypothetical protein
MRGRAAAGILASPDGPQSTLAYRAILSGSLTVGIEPISILT